MRHFVLVLLALIAGLAGGFIGGVVALGHAQTIATRQLVIVDDAGKPRAFIAVAPQPGAQNCPNCDGQAHVVVFDQRTGRPAIWPPMGPQMSPAQLMELLKALGMLAKFGGL